jgi:hypothetical protein
MAPFCQAKPAPIRRPSRAPLDELFHLSLAPFLYMPLRALKPVKTTSAPENPQFKILQHSSRCDQTKIKPAQANSSQLKPNQT